MFIEKWKKNRRFVNCDKMEKKEEKLRKRLDF